MKQYKSVLAFGDSHVSGCELLGDEYLDRCFNRLITLEEMDTATKPYSYPNIVAKKLNIPCYNYGLSGGCNARSLRLLPKALKDHPDSLVIFCYTEPHRSEIYYPDDRKIIARDNDNYLQMGIHWEMPNVKNSLNTYFVENMLRIKDDFSLTLNTMFYVDQACKNLASDYFHIFGFAYLYDSLFPPNDRILNINLPTNGGYGDFKSWCESKNYIQARYNHYPQDAHIAFAEFIIENL